MWVWKEAAAPPTRFPCCGLEAAVTPEVQGLLQRAPHRRHRIPGPLIKHENWTSPLKSIFPKNTIFSMIKLNYQINTTRSTGSRHAVVTMCLAPTIPTAELAACVTQVFPSDKLVKQKRWRMSGRHKNYNPGACFFSFSFFLFFLSKSPAQLRSSSHNYTAII